MENGTTNHKTQMQTLHKLMNAMNIGISMKVKQF